MGESEKSQLLLQHLRRNAREKLTEISKQTRIPISTLFDLLKELQQGPITKSTVLLDFSKLGYHTRAHVFLKVNKSQRENLCKHLSCHNNVNSVYKTQNDWDFIIETVHANIKELDCFLERLDQNFMVERQQIHHIVADIKKEGFMSNDLAN